MCKKNERERNIRKGSERTEKLRSEEDSFKKSMIKGGECVTIWLRVTAALISIQIKVNWSVGLSLSLSFGAAMLTLGPRGCIVGNWEQKVRWMQGLFFSFLFHRGRASASEQWTANRAGGALCVR